MQREIKLKIVSDGTNVGTKVTDLDGNILPGVKKIIFIADSEKDVPNVLIEISGDIPIEIESQTKVIQPSKIVGL